MFDEGVWKYFLYFLFIALIVFFIYVIYKISLTPVKEGFQKSGVYSYELRINELNAWNLSLPPEFETIKTSWSSGFSPHFYVGTLNSVQQSTIIGFERYFNNWAAAFRKTSYDVGGISKTAIFAFDTDYYIDPNRVRISGSQRNLEVAQGVPTIASWITVTPTDLRRLNPILADIVVSHLYTTQTNLIKEIEWNAWRSGWGKADWLYDNWKDDGQKGVADYIKGNLSGGLIGNKSRNEHIATYITLDAVNSEAAQEYLRATPDAQTYLDQVGAFLEWTAIGELAGPVMDSIGGALKAVRGARYSRGFLTVNARNLVFNVRRTAQLKILAAARRLKLASTLIKEGRMAGQLIRSIGAAVRGAKTALFANPVGIVMALADAILSLIPDSIWRSWGEERAEREISDKWLRCPVGYIDGNKLSLDEFSSYLDMLPIPSGFGEMEKAKARKLTCVSFDDTGQADTQTKRQCTWPGSSPSYNGDGDKRIAAWSSSFYNSMFREWQRSEGNKVGFKNLETCFGDPDPPMEIFPLEPVVPTLDSVEEAFRSIAGTVDPATNTLTYFQDVGLVSFFPSSWSYITSATKNVTIPVASNEIYSRIRQEAFISPLQQYNSNITLSNTSNAINMLNSNLIPVGIEQNFDFYYKSDTGSNAISSFLAATPVERGANSMFARKFDYLSTFTSQLSNILINDLADIKTVMSSPNIFSPTDTKTYSTLVTENVLHTLSLLPYREKLVTYTTGKVVELLRYDKLTEEYTTSMSNVQTEMGRFFDITSPFLNKCAQYIYDESYRISNGLTVTLIDKIVGAVITCDNLITIICNISCINKGKGTTVWKQPTPVADRYIDYYPPLLSKDNNVPIEIYLDNNGTITAWGRPSPDATTPSLLYKYVMRRVILDYTPTISYKYTSYFRTACSTTTTLQTQLNYYKENNPTKNIKAITGWKVINVSTCAMQWRETDYNTSENTESGETLKTARFLYETPNTPYPYKDGKPLYDEYQGYITTTGETPFTSVNVSQPKRGLPPEVTLLGNCGKRCYDPAIMKAIMDKYNSDTYINGGTSKIVNIKKIFTAKDNRCDFVANVNTGKGTIQEQRRKAIVTLLSTPACTYRVDSIGAIDSGTFVSFAEGFQSVPLKESFQNAVDLNVTPYPGYFYQSTTVNSATVPKYNFGDNILGSVIGGIQNTWNNLTNTGTTTRLKTYATLGTDGSLEGCPTTKCSSDEIIKAMATKYNLDNWGKTRMNRVLKATTAGPLECDVYFEDLNISGSNRYVNFYRDQFNGRYASDRREITQLDNVANLTTTFYPAGNSYVNMSTVYYSMRFNMRKVPNTCKFEATSYKYMQPNPTKSDIEDLSKPPFTANTLTQPLTSPRNVSSIFGCGEVNICTDYNTNIMMGKLYQLQNPSNKLKSISRIYKSPLEIDKCTVEFQLTNKIGEFQPNSTNSNYWVRDTYIFTFTADSNTCQWRIQSAVPHPTDGLQFTKGANFGSKVQNYTPGQSILMENLKIPSYGFEFNPSVTSIPYRTPSCPTMLPLNSTSTQVRDSASNYYSLFIKQQITRFVDSFTVNSNTCEFKVETTAGTSFESTHLQFKFIPLSNCSGYQAIDVFSISKGDSYIDGWKRPENTTCYPIKCDSSNILALTSNQINPYNAPENSVTFNRIASVNSNTCEYEFRTPRISPISTYNPEAYKRITFKSFGSGCETIITSASNVTTQADSLTFKMPFSCPSFNPEIVFTQNVTNLTKLQSAIREIYLTTNMFTGTAATTSTYDKVNGPTIRTNGITILRTKLLSTPATNGNLRAELEMKVRVYLFRPNSVTYPTTLSFAKLGTLITQDTNQIDWNDWSNQFPVDPKNTWGPRQPPSEYKPTGIYEFSQSNFTTWQPVLHPVVEINFPTMNCSLPSIQDIATSKLLGLTFVQSKEQSIFP